MHDDQRQVFEAWAGRQPWTYAVVCTCGLDLELVEAVRRYTDAPLVVYEPRLERLADAPGATICTTPAALRMNVFGRIQEGGEACDLGQCDDAAVSAEYAGVLADVQHLIALNDATYRQLAAPWAKVLLEALPYWVDCPIIDDMADALKGAAAVIVGAGPSLDGNIGALRAARGRAVVVATNSAVGALAAAGVQPDVICVQDCHESIVAQLAAHPDVTASATLVAGFHVAAGVHELPWRRRVVVAEEGGPLARWLRGLLGVRRRFIAGGSVATFAFATCGLLGVRRVILAGLDCALSGGRFHATGTGMEHRLDVGPGTARISYDHGRVEDYETLQVEAWGGGGTVETTPVLDSYRIFWVDAAAVLAGKCEMVNATEGGARIAGWRESALETALAELGGDLDVDSALERAWASAPKIEAARLSDALRSERLRAAELEAAVTKAAALSAELEAADQDVRERIKATPLVQAGYMTAVYNLREQEPIRRVRAIYKLIGDELAGGMSDATREALRRIDA